MSCVASMTEYVGKALGSVSGMKALLLDKETAGMAALVLSQTDAIQREVFLTDRIDLPQKPQIPKLNARGEIERKKKETFHHLKAVAFIRPSPQSVAQLKGVMKSGKFKDFYIFFSNIAGDELLRSLAEGDELELVRQVSELYADYFALSDFVFHANAPIVRPLYSPAAGWSLAEKRLLERNSEALVSLLLSFKVRADIRYSASSPLAKTLALDLAKRQRDEADLFTFQTQAPLLLVLDRVDDPVTPLLTQWTYQAMVHELLGIEQNRVVLEGRPGIRKDLKEVVLSPQQDHFYKGSMYLNFGELGRSVKDLVQNYQRKTSTHARLDSIEDMQRFVDNYPEFRALSGTVSKHVAIMTELSRLVETRQLMRVSELEQELACAQDHSAAMDALLQLMEDPRIEWNDKLRLVMLYALRYENQRHQLPQFKKMLRDKANMEPHKLLRIRAIDAVLNHAGSSRRGGDLFSNKTLLSMAGQWMKSGLKGVENIYTQHKPLLAETLTLLSQNKLRTTTHPYTDSATATAGAKNKYRLIVVYIIGGATYEEVLAVENFNNANSGMRVVIGGNFMHNSETFIDDLLAGDSADPDTHSIHIGV